jgi:hypothetical protein
LSAVSVVLTEITCSYKGSNNGLSLNYLFNAMTLLLSLVCSVRTL